MGVVSRGAADGPSAHLEQVCSHEPANARAGDDHDDALLHTGNGVKKCSNGVCVKQSTASDHRGSAKGPTPPPMTPIAEDADNSEYRFPRGSGAPPAGSMVFESDLAVAEGAAASAEEEASAAAAAASQWQVASSQLLKSIVNGLSKMDDIYGASPTAAPNGETQEPAHESAFSPPLRPVKDFHAPRTDLTKEEFTLAAVGITISMTDGDPSKIVSAVQGGASVVGVCECDELVSINGEDVSSQEVNGFDCVELCQQAVREGGRSTVHLGVRDFCSMQLKLVEVEVSGGCPAIRHLRQRQSPALLRNSEPPSPSRLQTTSPMRLPSGSSYFSHANLDDRPYGSRPSSHHSEDWDDDVILHSTPRGGTLQRTHSPRSMSAGMTTMPEVDGEYAGWTWSVPSMFFWKIVGFIVLVGLGVVMYVRSVGGKEEVLTRLISSIDWLEAILQTLPLCPCTYWIRGSIVTVPLCRVCKPKVLRYHNYINNAALSIEKRAKGLCDLRPGWLMGKCRRSTDTTKYLGTFGTYEECEAACVSYNVGRDRCRALMYYSKTFKDRKFRQTCFALTHTGWNKVRELGVTTGRVLGPLSHLQRGLQYVRQELRRRVLLNWWDTGSPMEVALTMVLVIFGLSGIRRTPALDAETSAVETEPTF